MLRDLPEQYNNILVSMQTQQLQKTAEDFLAHIKKIEKFDKWTACDKKPALSFKADHDNSFLTKASTTYNLPFQTVVDFCSNPLIMNDATDEMERSEILHREEKLRVVFHKMKSFGPGSPRQIIAVNSVHLQGGKVYIGNRSCEYPCDLVDKNSVRSEYKAAGFIIEKVGDNETRVTMIVDSDYKGWIPFFVKTLIANKRAASLFKMQEFIKA